MLRLAVRQRCGSLTQVSPKCLPVVYQRRSFFGVGEIVGVLANPAETIRQLKESKELLAKAREEAELIKERKRIPKKHTFSQLPGFHGRKNEQGIARLPSVISSLTDILYQPSLGKSWLGTHR